MGGAHVEGGIGRDVWVVMRVLGGWEKFGEGPWRLVIDRRWTR